MTLKQPGAPVCAVATSPSGKRIVAAHGATITVWSAIAGEELGWCSLWDNIRAC
jgi:hypothetical protein